MTESENIDKIESSDNLTVTSDAAFERVTNDMKLDEGTDSGFLKQNTAGLVQEIPNISFLDIADTMLESKKTLHGRNNWNVVVGDKGKSIEVIPQDSIQIYQSTGLTLTGANYFVDISGSAEVTDDDFRSCFDFVMAEGGETYIEIKRPGYYRMSYYGSVENSDVANSASNKLEHGFSIWLEDFQMQTVMNKITVSMGYKYYESISNEYVAYKTKGDKIGLYINRGSESIDITQISFYVKYLSNIL